MYICTTDSNAHLLNHDVLTDLVYIHWDLYRYRLMHTLMVIINTHVHVHVVWFIMTNKLIVNTADHHVFIDCLDNKSFVYSTSSLLSLSLPLTPSLSLLLFSPSLSLLPFSLQFQ